MASNDIDLKILLTDINNAKIQLPEFQRGWTWDDLHIRGIIASVSQGYPMGAVMQLQCGNENIKFKYHPLEGVLTQNTPEFLILDGQQRLTSLFQSMYSSKVVSTKTEKEEVIKRFYFLSIKDCLAADVDRIDAILSVPEDKKIKENFDRDIKLDLSTREQEYANLMFPVNIIFDTKSLLDWTMGFFQYYQNKPELEMFKQFQTDVIEPILTYKLPVITLGKETPREAVCKIFENVNTGGVPLTVFELVTAIFSSCDEEFNLKQDWEWCKQKIQGIEDTLRTDLFDDIDETTFLTTVTLYTSYKNKQKTGIGAISCKKKDVLALKYEDYQENKEQVVLGFQLAREFLLKYQCVFRKRDLPYGTQIVPLAAIFAVLGKNRSNEPNILKILSQWYWCGILGEMYGGANETRFANDIEDIMLEIEGKQSLARTVNASFFSASRLLTLQTRLSAAYKGIMALIYKEKCRDFINDTTMDIVNSMMQPADIHHIFPEAYCKAQKIDRALYNSIVNKTPLLYATNRAIGGHAPSVYIQHILRKNSQLTEELLKGRIESHLINYELLKGDDFSNYFVDRAKKMLDLIEKAMGKKVADRSSENTIKKFGTTLE